VITKKPTSTGRISCPARQAAAIYRFARSHEPNTGRSCWRHRDAEVWRCCTAPGGEVVVKFEFRWYRRGAWKFRSRVRGCGVDPDEGCFSLQPSLELRVYHPRSQRGLRHLRPGGEATRARPWQLAGGRPGILAIRAHSPCLEPGTAQRSSIIGAFFGCGRGPEQGGWKASHRGGGVATLLGINFGFFTGLRVWLFGFR